MIHRTTIKTGLAVLLLAITIGCGEEKQPINFPKTDLAQAPIIPKPLKVVATESAFGLDRNTVIHTSSQNQELVEVAKFLSEKIQDWTRLELPVNGSTSAGHNRIIYINQADSPELESDEAYQLYVSKDSVILNAKTAAGAFRGVQTLRQIIPQTSNDSLAEHEMWLVPTGKIWDSPTFEYRGGMLDVARHFFSVEDVKKYIDVLAYYKFNVLHLHLTDDQGWRIEIKSWPKLTEIGGSTQVGGGEGGFYTQEKYKDIVAYAAARHMIIVPEVDMPGHTNAASVAYPFLNGNGKTPELYTGTEVGFSTFDAQKDTVYAFVDDVVREIASISPGPYFHIGGDESHVTKKDDYKLFVEKVNKIVLKYNKKMVGWDEVVTADIDPTAVVQYWSAEKNAKQAGSKGLKVILSPAKKAYLDMKYDSLSKHGLTWAAEIPVDTAYVWTPETYEPEIDPKNILGIEAPLWSETVSTIAEVEYLAFPRAIGYAELGWTPTENRNWEEYRGRLAKQVPYLEHMDIQYYPSARIDWENTEEKPKPILKD